MFYRYQYSFGEKATFIALWLLGSLFVAVNFFSNPILSIDASARTLSTSVAISQVLLLMTLWFQFVKASCSMNGMLRWLGLGVIVLPYLSQVGLLSYISF